jgi:hypothetical protein
MIMPVATTTYKKINPTRLFPEQSKEEIVAEILYAEQSGDMTWEEFVAKQDKWEQKHLK